MSNNKEYHNKKARFNYFISDEIEAGVVLRGSEVKAIRAGKLNMVGTYAKIVGKELFWIGADVNSSDSDNTQSKKLLIHRKELSRLVGMIEQKNHSLVPLKGYFKNGKFKLLLGLGKGKKKHDKREALKKKDSNREISRRIKY